jgi:DNA-binding transcriptional LysR family regulator
MELRQIRTYVVLAEELHFGRAALRLQIAQPAVSAQIQALERELGIPLLTRSTRRVQLTEAGAVFNTRCLDILRDIDRTCSLTQAVAGKDMTQITIGTIHPATFGVLPDFISRINQRYPDVRIHIHNGNTEDIVREIERGNINLAFIRPIENIGSLRWQAIHRERYLLAISHDNPLCQQNTIHLNDLREQRIISFSRYNKSYTDAYFIEKFKEYGLDKQISYTCNDTLAMLALVSAKVGVGFVPEWVTEIPGRNFELRKVEGVDLRIGLGLAWSTDDPTANRDSIIELCRPLIESPKDHL